MSKIAKIACIGECMLEVFDQGDGSARFAFGGDSLNTAIYLARLGVPVDYLTALGDDPYSARLMQAWAAEGVGTQQVLRIAGELPGLYTIRVDTEGERQFYYWRSQAPVKRLFSFPESAALEDQLVSYPWLYFTGITLMVLNSDDRERFYHALLRAKAGGSKIIFDSNYRKRGWASAADAAQEFQRFIALCEVYLPSSDDAAAVFGHSSAESTFAQFEAIPEVVLKDGQRGCTLKIAGEKVQIAAVKVERVIDSTAAGDSFNAAYLAMRLLGESPAFSAAYAAELAAVVVQNKGAIIDRPPMSRFLGALRHRYS